MNQTVAKFIVPDCGDKVNSGLVGGYDNPMTARRSQLYPPVRDYESSYWMRMQKWNAANTTFCNVRKVIDCLYLYM